MPPKRRRGGSSKPTKRAAKESPLACLVRHLELPVESSVPSSLFSSKSPPRQPQPPVVYAWVIATEILLRSPLSPGLALTLAQPDDRLGSVGGRARMAAGLTAHRLYRDDLKASVSILSALQSEEPDDWWKAMQDDTRIDNNDREALEPNELAAIEALEGPPEALHAACLALSPDTTKVKDVAQVLPPHLLALLRQPLPDWKQAIPPYAAPTLRVGLLCRWISLVAKWKARTETTTTTWAQYFPALPKKTVWDQVTAQVVYQLLQMQPVDGYPLVAEAIRALETATPAAHVVQLAAALLWHNPKPWDTGLTLLMLSNLPPSLEPVATKVPALQAPWKAAFAFPDKSVWFQTPDTAVDRLLDLLTYCYEPPLRKRKRKPSLTEGCRKVALATLERLEVHLDGMAAAHVEALLRLGRVLEASDDDKDLWKAHMHTMMLLGCSVPFDESIGVLQGAADRRYVLGNLVTRKPDASIAKAFVEQTLDRWQDLESLLKDATSVPLCLEEARILVYCFFCLPTIADRRTTVLSMVDCLTRHVEDTTLSKNASELLGRCLVVVTHMALALVFGNSARVDLKDAIAGSLLSDPPPPRDWSVPHYLSVVDPLRPGYSTVVVKAEHGLVGGPRLTQLLLSCLELGFKCAAGHGSDYLLFASWHLSSLSWLWDVETRDFVGEQWRDTKLHSRTMHEMRDDMFFLHVQTQHHAGNIPRLSLQNAYKERAFESVPQSKNMELSIRNMIGKAETLLDSVIAATESDDSSTGTNGTFAILRALPVYLAFAISACTMPMDDPLAKYFPGSETSRHRDRGYSTDSQAFSESSQSDQIPQIAPIEELFDLCSKLGHVPSHPDWLDSRCIFREDITRAIALELSTKALAVFTRMLNFSSMWADRVALEALKESGQSLAQASLTLKLAHVLRGSSSLETATSTDSDGELVDESDLVRDVSRLCGIHISVARMLLLEDKPPSPWSDRSATLIAGKWNEKPLPACADTIQFRALGQWENNLCLSFSPVLRDDMTSTWLAASWSSVTSTSLSCMIPAAALVRFSLAKEGARKHPALNGCKQYGQANWYPSMDMVSNVEASRTDDLSQATALALKAVATFVNSPPVATIASFLLRNREGFKQLRTAILLQQSFGVLGLLDRHIRASPQSSRDAYWNVVKSIGSRLCSVCDASMDHISLSVGLWRRPKKVNVESVAGSKHDIFAMIPVLAPGGEFSTMKATAQILGNILLDSAVDDRLDVVGPFFADLAARVSVDPAMGIAYGDFFDMKGAPPLNHLLQVLSSSSKDGMRADIASLLVYSARRFSSGKEYTWPKEVLVSVAELVRIAVAYDTTSRESSLCLWLFLVFRSGGLPRLGSDLLSRATFSDDAAILEYVHSFFMFLCLLWKGKSTKTAVAETEDVVKSGPLLCTYAERAGFFVQHWYNCYTCELVDDKGCCSACARICHRGHRLAYARCSSFFCDCGSSTAASGNDGLCGMCMLPSKEAHGAMLKRKCCSVDTQRVAELANAVIHDGDGTFYHQCQEEAIRSDWVGSLSKLLQSSLSSGRRDEAMVCRLPLSAVSSFDIRCAMGDSWSERSFTFSASVPTDYFEEQAHFSFTRSPVSDRACMALGQSGRLLIIDGLRVTLANILPTLGSREDQLLFIVASGQSSFFVRDVCLSPQSNRFALAWGRQEAVIWSTNESSRPLKNVASFGLQDDRAPLPLSDDESIVHCRWSEDTDKFFVIGCSRSLHFYAVTSNEAKDGQGFELVSSMKLEEGLTLESFCLAKLGQYPSSTAERYRVYVVLSDGSTRSVDVAVDLQGTIIVGCALAVEESLRDIRFYHVAYVPTSRHLLLSHRGSHKVSASAVSPEGTVSRSFVFLPSPLFGMEESIVGPFTDWNDMGAVFRDADVCFQVIFRGRTETGRPVVLCAEYNAEKTTLSRINDGMSPAVSLACLTIPLLMSPRPDYGLHLEDPWFEQKRVVCSLVSDGVLLNLSNAGVPCIRRDGRDFLHLTVPKASPFPITVFEDMKNVTEADELVLFGDDQASSDGLKSQLSRESDAILRSGDTDGLCLGVSLVGSPQQELVIAGVRLRFGSSSPGSIPSMAYVQGRPVALEEGVPRWYDVPLSVDEVVRGLRMGFISVRVGPAFDGSSFPAIDALEVFAVDKVGLHWLPVGEKSIVACPRRTYPALHKAASAIAAVSCLLDVVPMNQALQEYRSLVDCLVKISAIYSPHLTNEISIDSLLSHLDSDVERCQSTSDAITIRCLETELQGAPEATKTLSVITNDCVLWKLLSTVSEIARDRPLHYLQAISDNGKRSTRSLSSLAARALRSRKTLGLLIPFVHLCLNEASVMSGLSIDQGEAAIRALLSVLSVEGDDTQSLVLVTCRAIASYFAQGTSRDGARLYYGCDTCGKFPIVGYRYSIEGSSEGDPDLCSDCFTHASESPLSGRLDKGPLGSFKHEDVKRLRRIAVSSDGLSDSLSSQTEAFDSCPMVLSELRSLVSPYGWTYRDQIILWTMSEIMRRSSPRESIESNVAEFIEAMVCRLVDVCEGSPALREDRVTFLVRTILNILPQSGTIVRRIDTTPETSDFKCTIHGLPLHSVEMPESTEEGRLLICCRQRTSCNFKFVEQNGGLLVVAQHSALVRLVWKSLFSTRASGATASDALSSLLDELSFHRHGGLPAFGTEAGSASIEMPTERMSDEDGFECIQHLITVRSPGATTVCCGSVLELFAQVARESGSLPPSPSLLRTLSRCASRYIKTNNTFGQLAELALSGFCGTKRSQIVCEYFFCSDTYDNMARDIERIIDGIVLVLKKASYSRPNWRSCPTPSRDSVSPSDVLNVTPLIPDGLIHGTDESHMATCCGAILSAASRQPYAWKRFVFGSTHGNEPSSKRATSRIFIGLLAISCAHDGDLQEVALKLIDAALSSTPSSDIDDVGHDATGSLSLFLPPSVSVCSSLSVDTISTFIIRFVLRGRSAKCRNLSTSICSKMIMQLSREQASFLLLRLTLSSLRDLVQFGRHCCEAFAVLKLLALRAHSFPKLRFLAKTISSAWAHQMSSTRSRTRTTPEARIEPTSCVSCSSSSTSGKTTTDDGTEAPIRHRNQVGEFSRIRLDSSRSAATSDDFCLFFSLNRRVVINEVHFEVLDPRHRHGT